MVRIQAQMLQRKTRQSSHVRPVMLKQGRVGVLQRMLNGICSQKLHRFCPGSLLRATCSKCST